MRYALPLRRRSILRAAAALPVLIGSRIGRAQSLPDRSLTLWYRQPAREWEEALPIGNGRFGAMVFGRVLQERLQLNEDTLWAGGPYTPDNPEALAALPEVRRLIAAGRFKEAHELTAARIMAKPLVQMPYGTLGDVFLTFDKGGLPIDYERSLDLKSATTVCRYRTAGGEVRREVFASAPDQVIVMRIECKGGGRIGCTVDYRGPRKVQYSGWDAGEQGLIAPHGPDWSQTEDVQDASGARITASSDGSIRITGTNASEQGIPAQLRYALFGKIHTDGTVKVEGGRLTVSGARTVTMLLAAATSYRRYDDVSGNPEAMASARLNAAAAKSYAQLRKAHVAEYRGLFDRFSIALPTGVNSDVDTDRRIRLSPDAPDPALAALYVQFGRYLLISSSRPGTQPANLQGIWNHGINPPWGSKYTININTEMNYWLADPTGLGVCFEPLLKMVEDLAVRGAATAKTMYGAGGWMTHHNTDLWRAAAPVDGPAWGMWPCGGAWLCNTLWSHYEYAPSEALLSRLYPLLKGASQFFLDTLIEAPNGRELITSPSSSPENQHPFGASICAGPAMDRQIIRDLFAYTAEAGRSLGRDAEFVGQVAAARARLAPDRIGKSGQFQEWLEDWDDAAPEPQHRHTSHLYAVYPSEQVNVRDTPALAEAARVTLRKRGDLSTGWATAWRVALWARLGDGDRAHSILSGLLGPMRTYPNMMDAHPPFQIDGNLGAPAGVLEMLVQSWGGEIRLLPALPMAWPDGEVRGLRAKGGLSLDLVWSNGRLAKLLVKGPARSSHALRYGERLWKVRLDRNGIYRFAA
jgi:alpha-L-fucosidase 2